MRVADKLREKSGQLGMLIREIVDACDEAASEGKNEITLSLALGANLNTSKAIAEWAKKEGFTNCVYEVTQGTLTLRW